MTAAAVAVKVAVADPAGTRTAAGMVSAEETVLYSSTLVPPPGAFFERVTVQVVEVEAAMLAAAQPSEETDMAPVIMNVRDWLDVSIVAVRTG